MPIVSSTVSEEVAQKDGRKWVEERHTDHVGLVYVLRYLASSGVDINAVLSARATQILNDLVRTEIAANLSRILADGSLANVTIVYATLADIRTALREAYQNATRLDAIMLGDFLSSLTNGQLQTLFSMSAGQVTSLRTNKLTPAATEAASIRQTTGA